MKHLIVFALSLAGASLSFAHCGSCEGDSAAADHAHDKDGKHAAAITCSDGCCELLSSYEKVAVALAADDLEGAKSAASDLECFAHCNDNEALGNEIAKVVKAASIADARTAFKTVSAKVIAEADGKSDYYVMTCPMAGADWIQTSKEVANPYYGSQMLKCGAVKKTVTAKL